MKKFLLSLLLIGLGIVNFSSASYELSVNSISYTTVSGTVSVVPNAVYCFQTNYNTAIRYVDLFYQDFSGKLNITNNKYLCFDYDPNYTSFSYQFSGTSYNELKYFYYTISIPACDYSDYELKSNITQNYCTNKFSNLIPEEDITSGYCEVEFGLIDPENCPSVPESTGDVQIMWSSFWVNDHQIQGADNIYLYLPDFLSWDYTYINSGSTLQIDVENEGNEEYIEDLLKIETYHPSSDEFAVSFVSYLTLLMPYIIITLFVIFVWKLIKRIFK